MAKSLCLGHQTLEAGATFKSKSVATTQTRVEEELTTHAELVSKILNEISHFRRRVRRKTRSDKRFRCICIFDEAILDDSQKAERVCICRINLHCFDEQIDAFRKLCGSLNIVWVLSSSEGEIEDPEERKREEIWRADEAKRSGAQIDEKCLAKGSSDPCFQRWMKGQGVARQADP